MAITYDAPSNAVIVTGFTDEVRCNLDDIRTEDLAGSIQLMASKAAAMDMDLDRQIKPADSGALRLTIVITGYSSPPWDITLNGTDNFDVAQQEVVHINGDGSYETVEYWKTIDADGIDCNGGTTTGNVEIRQPRWGVINKSFGSSYGVDAKIVVGNNSTPSYFGEDSCAITFSDYMGDTIEGKLYSYIRLGKVVSVPLKIGEKGVACIFTGLAARIKSIGDLEIYSSSFLDVNAITVGRIYFQGTLGHDFKMWGCSLDNVDLYLNPATSESAMDVYRINIKDCTYALTPVPSWGVYDDLFIDSAINAFYAAAGVTFTVKNVVLRNNTYVAYCTNFSGNFNIINGDVDNWVFNWPFDNGGKVWRQYEFDAHCQDKNGNDLSGVSVVSEYISPYGQAFSETTDVNGDIPTQTVDHGWFDQPHLPTEQLKTPLKVTYSKAGYQTVVKYYDLDEKTKDVVVLHKAVGIFLSFGSPVVNLKKTDPENKNVMVVG